MEHPSRVIARRRRQPKRVPQHRHGQRASHLRQADLRPRHRSPRPPALLLARPPSCPPARTLFLSGARNPHTRTHAHTQLWACASEALRAHAAASPSSTPSLAPTARPTGTCVDVRGCGVVCSFSSRAGSLPEPQTPSPNSQALNPNSRTSRGIRRRFCSSTAREPDSSVGCAVGASVGAEVGIGPGASRAKPRHSKLLLAGAPTLVPTGEPSTHSTPCEYSQYPM